VGLGLYNERGISLVGLERAKLADQLYIELYTNPMPRLLLKKVEELVGKQVTELNRRDLEETPEQTILKNAERQNVVLLVPGDPLIATTHIDLRLRAHKAGIDTEIVHGATIYSAVASASGLQIYKFGRTVTIPHPTPIYRPETPYDVLKENTAHGLHTLMLLDLDAERKRYMRVEEGLRCLVNIEEKRREGVVPLKRLAVGLSGVGSPAQKVRGDSVEHLLKINFGDPPHSLIFPASLHFMEAEALKVFASTPEEVLRA
jgi:diphthine synthase